MRLTKAVAMALAGVAVSWTVGASAEVKELRVARQYGIGYLQLMVMAHDKLIEKQAKVMGDYWASSIV